MSATSAAEAALAVPPPSEAAASAVQRPARLESVDLLRGLVMVLMAIDHTRDFTHAGATLGDPELLADPGLLLFFTRWITHFCAPIFVFLAGTGAFLSLGRGKSKAELSRFLVTRGLWLVLLELTVVKFGFAMSVDPHFFFGQVIWVLGWGMVLLAALIHLPMPAIAAFGAVLVLGHNAFDGIGVPQAITPTTLAVGPGAPPPAMFSAQGLWMLLHVPGMVQVMPDVRFFVRYPLIPWIGVLALGYAFGPVMRLDEAARRRMLVRIGGAAVIAFLVLRATNLYGDPRPWSAQGDAAKTLIAFLNTQKYPPSLLYLLMTLGPGILLLAAFERARGAVADALIVFGRVPLFYYVLHLPLIQLASALLILVTAGTAGFGPRPGDGPPVGWGWNLGVTYAAWAAIIALLFPLCRWFAGVKARRRDWWLGYL